VLNEQRQVLHLECPLRLQLDPDGPFEPAARWLPLAVRSRLTADSMAAEVKRQTWTRILVLGPAQLAQRAVTFVRSGAIFQPRNIILGLTMIAGFAFGGFQSCKVGKLNKQLGTQQVRIEECDEELGLAKQMGADSAEMNFKQLASRITTSSKLGTALEADKELQKLVKKEAAAMMAEPASFDWLVKGKGVPQARAFNQWRGRVFKSEIFDNDTRLLMTWLVSRPEQTQEEWTMGVDSMGVDTCLRGPMRLTFRQSKNLGFASRLDGWAPGGSASVETPDARKELLSRTATSAGIALPDPIEMEVTASDQGAGVCVHELGDDGRKEVRDLLKQLEAALGPNAEGLPGPENNSAAVARVAAYWAADMPEVRYDPQKKEWEGLKLDTKVISKRLEDKETRGMWALKHTARTIAQAVVVPCPISPVGVMTTTESSVPMVTQTLALRPAVCACAGSLLAASPAPRATDFCTISKLARLVTSTNPWVTATLCRTSVPTNLSRALCRPTSSRR
jgi:hypothetical protein